MADGQWPLLSDRRVCDLRGVWKCERTRKSGTLRISLSSLPPFSPSGEGFELLTLIVPTVMARDWQDKFPGGGRRQIVGTVAWLTLISRIIEICSGTGTDWISRRLEYRLFFNYFDIYILFNKEKFLFQWDGKIILNKKKVDDY